MKTIMNYKKLLFMPLSLALVVGLSACSIGGEEKGELESFGIESSQIKKDGIAKEADKNSAKDDSSTEEDNENSTDNTKDDNTMISLDKESKDIEGSVKSLISSDSVNKAHKYTDEDLRIGKIFIETQDLLGSEVFEQEDTLAAIEALDSKKVDKANKELEKKFVADRSKTSYNGLTPSEKVLFNTFLGLFQAEASRNDDIKVTGIDKELVSIDDNGDAVLPPGSVLVTDSSGDGALYDTSFRLYKDNGEWKLDALDFIGNYYAAS